MQPSPWPRGSPLQDSPWGPAPSTAQLEPCLADTFSIHVNHDVRECPPGAETNPQMHKIPSSFKRGCGGREEGGAGMASEG